MAMNGKDKLKEQVRRLEMISEENPCRLPDNLLGKVADAIEVIIGHEYAKGISRDDVARYLGISTRTLERWQIEHKDFPKPRHKGFKSVSYDCDEIIEWKKKHSCETKVSL